MNLDIVKLFLQLGIIGVLGGAVSWFYSKIQKSREFRYELVKELAKTQGGFLALRYEYNTFHLTWNSNQIMQVAKNLDVESINKLKWEKYERACELLGDYQSIKPLLIQFYPNLESDFNQMHQTYQEWRRRIREGSPIYQTKVGKTDNQLKQHKDVYNYVISTMRRKI